jgi:hypothetical protein
MTMIAAVNGGRLLIRDAGHLFAASSPPPQGKLLSELKLTHAHCVV